MQFSQKGGLPYKSGQESIKSILSMLFALEIITIYWGKVFELESNVTETTSEEIGFMSLFKNGNCFR